MISEDRLTAYALNDPGLTAAERAEVDAALAADAGLRREVEETRKLAGLLTTSLAAEAAAQPAEAPVAVPVGSPHRKQFRRALLALAASVLALAGLSGYLLTREKDRQFAKAPAVASADGRGERETHFTDLPEPTVANDPAAMKPAPNAEGERGEADVEKRLNLARSMPPAGGIVPTEGAPLPADNATRLAARMPPAAGYGGVGQPGRLSVGKGDKAEMDKLQAPRQFAMPQPKPASGDGKDVRDLYAKEKEEVQREALGGQFRGLVENRFIPVQGQDALSTFGIDVDTASYAIVRKYLTMGQLPPQSAVRLEEMVNYFPYADKAPDDKNPFAVTVELAECPWQPKHRLARIGLKARPIDTKKRPPSNLVFLIDVSGSMNEPNKLPWVKQSLKMLVNELGENDRVAMVVYAGTTGLVLDSTSAAKKDRILEALDRLEAGGSTNGSGGIQQAYAVAAANFLKGGTNRVILCTDGDWNVGTTGTDALVKLIEEKRKTGVFLSVLGFGMGNLRDEMMVQLAGKGNGNYAYIDTLKEAHKTLVEQLGGTLVTVAKDVKIQVEFNPATVSSYRLLGYEKRILAAKDFHDDTKDAGEMGAGHVVTALYELVPAGQPAPGTPKVDALRYQQNAEKPAGKSGESFVVKMRHKKPDGDVSTLRELPVTDPGKGYGDASEDFRFSAAVASFALLLRNSEFKGQASFALTEELAGAAMKFDPSGYRAEFLDLVRKAKAIAGAR